MKFRNDISGRQAGRCRDGARPVSTSLRSSAFVMPPSSAVGFAIQQTSFLPHSKIKNQYEAIPYFSKVPLIAMNDDTRPNPYSLIWANKGIREDKNRVNSAIKGASQNKGLVSRV